MQSAEGEGGLPELEQKAQQVDHYAKNLEQELNLKEKIAEKNH
jgi:hypothetical protein